jgi:hypothetical protein
MAKGKAQAQGSPPPAPSADTPADRDSYGVLVGWTHGRFDGRIDLRLQTAHSSGALAKGEIDNCHIVMTPNQATLLANYLFTITNQTPPPQRKRGRLAKWFGS